MAPKSPWKNSRASAAPNSKTQNHADGGNQPAINYVEVQDDEIEALKAIYMDDYQAVEVKGAWSKTTDRRFKLTLRAFSDLESTITLSVGLTATYPRTAPLLQVDGLQKYHERTRTRIEYIIENKPNSLLGDVMIHEIASTITDALEDAVQARQQGSLPSLDFERINAEETALELAKQAEKAQAQRQLEIKDEEDRVLKQMVDDELQRRQKRKHGKQSDFLPDVGPPATCEDEVISFEQAASTSLGSQLVHFSAVSIVEVLDCHDGGRTCLGKAIFDGTRFPTPFHVMVKQLNVDLSRAAELELETTLSRVKSLRHHPSIQALYSYRTDTVGPSRQLTLCSERWSQSLREVLESGLWVTKARQYMIDILEGTEFLHSAGLCHGCLTVDNIFVAGRPPQIKIGSIGLPGTMMPSADNLSRLRAEVMSEGPSAKSDIRALGLVFVQMLAGLGVVDRHSSIHSLLGDINFSEVCEVFIRRMLVSDPKQRRSAFEMLNAEFLRTDAPVNDVATSERKPVRLRTRPDSSNGLEPTMISRYGSDFTELSRIGKGGFGEVVKARNKLDGGIYAIKKIKQAPQLDKILSEVKLLNRLNHPYVVRYFSTWTEIETSHGGGPESMSETTTETITTNQTASGTASGDDSEPEGLDLDYQSAGLDFVSSTGHIQFGDNDDDYDKYGTEACEPSRAREQIGSFEQDIQFGEDRNSSAVESDEASQDSHQSRKKTRSYSRRLPVTLYIQMEYCERQTLRDIIRKGLGIDDAWKYVRQITEGLANIHSNGVIHRDMKPDNIFIDLAGNPKIGDFGLATTGQYYNPERTSGGQPRGDMTRSIGTVLYVAPELRSGGSTTYNNKVDMYSLGIMFFEMCESFATAMERIQSIQSIRKKDFSLPAIFHTGQEKAAQGKLITCLLSHKPSERPSSTELLRGDILPVKIEDETIRQFIDSLSDQHSPYHQKLMSVLFAQDSTKRVKALAWDAQNKTATAKNAPPGISEHVRKTLMAAFRRHGATMAHRQGLFPRSAYYSDPRVVQILDAYGNLLQLPYDLTFAHAREVASDTAMAGSRTYCFGNVYRDTIGGGAPRVIEEVDFDLVGSPDRPEIVDDAEILATVDEIISELPLLARQSISFHINHTSILNAVMDFCRVPPAQQSSVKEAISKLGFHMWNWAKLRKELASAAYGLPSTTLDDMQLFDFREPPEKATNRLQNLLGKNPKIETSLDYLRRLATVATAFGLNRKIFVTPLSSFNAKFYEGGILFQCVIEHKNNKDVLAAGGRYDCLIQTLQRQDGVYKPPGAVGVAFALDRLLASLSRDAISLSRSSLRDTGIGPIAEMTKSAHVLLILSNFLHLLPTGQKILRELWSKHISAVLASSDKTAEDFKFVVTLKHEASTTVRVKANDGSGFDEDVPVSSLATFILERQREREVARFRPPTLRRRASQSEGDNRSNVNVLMAQHRSKKTNKYQIVEAAQSSWSYMLRGAENAPLLAVETRDDVMELLRYTRLGDAESWRKAIQSAQLNERQYLQQVQGFLSELRTMWEAERGPSKVGIFNFRSGNCIAYDVDL